jgi:hypothetical protein
MTKLRVAGPENSSSAGYRAACFHRSRPVLPAGFSFAFAGRGELLMLLPFKAMLPLGHARKSGGPPLFEPSFKVQRENAHNQSSGSTAAPGLEGLNARGPLKVHPKWRLELSALASPAVAQFVSAFFLRVLAEVPRKQGKIAAEHPQRTAGARQVCRSTR